MGNWDGIGVANMTDSQAQAFAEYLAYLAYTVGLDGFSFDDEYANYSDALVSGSFGRVISYLRDALDEYGMEDALINVFQYGNYGSTQITSSDGTLIDYAYNSYLGTWSGLSLFVFRFVSSPSFPPRINFRCAVFVINDDGVSPIGID